MSSFCRKCPTDERQDVGLQAAILSIFPITDYNETAAFEFMGYVMKRAKVQCQGVPSEGHYIFSSAER